MKKIKYVLILCLCALTVYAGKAEEPPEPIKFKADSLEYVYKKGKEKVTCKGRAKIERSDFLLKAKLIYLYGENRDYAEAYDDVILVNKTNNVVIYGDYAEFDNQAGYGKVFKSPKLVQTNKGLEITSAIMETYINDNRSIALGDVVIVQTNYIAYSEKAVIWHEREIIELTGDPVVYKDKDVFRAEKIIVYIKNDMIKLYGNVGVRIISKENQ